MRRFGIEDKKHLDNVIKGLQRAKFTEISGPEILSMAFAFQWLGELKVLIEAEIKTPPQPTTPIPSPTTPSAQSMPEVKEEKPSNKRKKK